MILPIAAKSDCGLAETMMALPSRTEPATSSVQSTTEAWMVSSFAALRLPSMKISEPGPPSPAETSADTSFRARSGVRSSAPVSVAISTAVNRRDGSKNTGSVMQTFSSGPVASPEAPCPCSGRGPLRLDRSRAHRRSLRNGPAAAAPLPARRARTGSRYRS
jgi:hypothetical protein